MPFPSPSRTRRLLASASITVLSLSLLSACDGGSSSTSNGAVPTVLNIGTPQGATMKNNNNPLLPTSAASLVGYRYMIFEPIAMWNPVKPAETPKPWLAGKVQWSDNYKKLTLTARAGVKFSDGVAMTAEDLAYAFQLMKTHAALNINALPIDSATAQGDQAVITFTSSQFVRQASVLSTVIVPKHLWSALADPTTDTIAKPVGTGPYTLKSFTPQTVTLTQRKGYWQDAPKVTELRYTTYSGNDAITSALNSGAAEWTYAFLPDAKKLFQDKDPQHNKLWFPPNLSADGLWINTTVKPFDNPALRRAMSMVVNRADIFNLAEAGYFKPQVDSITGLPTPAGDAFIAPQYKDKKASADTATAKELLTDNGFSYNGDTLVAPSGTPVSLKLSDPAGWGDYQTALTIIADNFKAIGIKTTIDKADENAWQTDIAAGKFQAAMRWSNGGATPYDFYKDIMDGASLKPIGQAATGNYGRFNSPEATKALEAYANASDDASRTAALGTLQKIFAEQVPMIATSAGNLGAEYSTKHWIGWPDDSNPYAAGQFSQTTALDVVLHLKPATN